MNVEDIKKKLDYLERWRFCFLDENQHKSCGLLSEIFICDVVLESLDNAIVKHYLHFESSVDLLESQSLAIMWSTGLNNLFNSHEQVRKGNSYFLDRCKSSVINLESLPKHAIGSEVLRMFLERHLEYCSDAIQRSDYYT